MLVLSWGGGLVGLRGTPAAIAETDVMSLFTVGIGGREEMKHALIFPRRKIIITEYADASNKTMRVYGIKQNRIKLFLLRTNRRSLRHDGSLRIHRTSLVDRHPRSHIPMPRKEEVIGHAANPHKAVDHDRVIHIARWEGQYPSSVRYGRHLRLGFGPVVGNMDNTTPKMSQPTAMHAMGLLNRPV